MEIASGNIGSVGTASVEFTGGKLVATEVFGGGMVKNTSEIDGKLVLDAIIAKLPGGIAHDAAKAIEDAILGVGAVAAPAAPSA